MVGRRVHDGRSRQSEEQSIIQTTTSSQFGSLESVVDDWLGTGLDARHVVSHGVHAGLGGVDLDDALELGLATRQLVLPEDALRFALLDDEGLGVLSVRDPLVDNVGLVGGWVGSPCLRCAVTTVM